MLAFAHIPTGTTTNTRIDQKGFAPESFSSAAQGTAEQDSPAEEQGSELLVPLPGAALAKSRAAIKKVSIGEAEGERFEPSVPVRQSTFFNTAGSSNGG